jgi:ketosteroid isomerase-like protein
MPRMARIRPLVKIAVAFALAGALAGCTMWSAKPASWQNATGAEQFERLWWQDVKDKKWDAVERRLAGSYVTQDGGASYNRSQAMERLKKLEISEFTLGEVEAHPGGGEIIILTYQMSLRGSYDGQPFTLQQSRMMTVWQRQKSGWVAIAHSESTRP